MLNKKSLYFLFALNIACFAGNITIDDTQYLGAGDDTKIYNITETGLLLVADEGFIGGLTGDGEINVFDEQRVILNATFIKSTEFDGTVLGEGVFTISSATLTLNGSTTLSGGFELGGSSLNLQSSDSGGPGFYSISNNSNLNINASTSIGGFLTPGNYDPGDVAGVIEITSGKSLTFGADNIDYTYNGTIQGDGNFVKLGTGTLDMTQGSISNDENSIDDGQIKTLTSTFTQSNPIITVSGNGSLNFTDTTNSSWNGNIKGDGKIYKSGSSTMTLGAAQDFTGTFYIQSGVLSEPGNFLANALLIDISAGATYETTSDTTVPDLTGAGIVSTPAGVTLSLENSEDSTFTGAIAGDGTLVKSGLATLTQSGTWNKTSTCSISQGTLNVLGDVSSHSLMTIQKAGTVRGIGTIGDVEIFGSLFPGQSIGTITVSGNYTQKAGSSLQIEFDGDGNSSSVSVSGSSTIDPGANLLLYSIGSTPLSQGTTYTIMTTGSGVNGYFSGASSPFNPNLHSHFFTVDYFANSIQFTLGPRKPIQNDASIINMTSDLSKQVNLVQMDNISSWLNSNMRNRDSCNPTEKFTPFILYDYRNGEYRRHECSIPDQFALNNVTAGLQLNLIDHFGFGFAYGYTRSDFKTADNPSKLKANSNSIIAFCNYGCFYNFQFDGQIAQTFTNFQSGRAELNNATSSARFNGYETGVEGRVSYEADLAGFELLPSFGMRYAYSYVDSYNESGQVNEQLYVKSDHMNQLYGSIGCDFSYPWKLSSWIIRPHSGIYYLYQFLDDFRTITTSYDNYTTAKNLCIGNTGHNFGEFTLGLDFGKGKSNIFIDFDTYFGTHYNFTYDLRMGITTSF